MADKNRQIHVRLSEDEHIVIRWLARYDGADGISDWVRGAIKARFRDLQQIQGWSVELMRRNLEDEE